MYNLAAIRELFLEGFNDEDLTIFCQDLPELGSVARDFTAAQTLTQRVLLLIGYAERRGQLDLLLNEVKRTRPHKFALFEDKVRAEPTSQFSTLTPNQAAAPFIRAFDLPTRQQVKQLTEYKGVHDHLQLLEMSYRVVANEIFENDKILPAERVRWRPLNKSLQDLRTAITTVCDLANVVSFAADTVEWLRMLCDAQEELQVAYERRDIESLSSAVTDIFEVVSRQTSRMNVCLINALDDLPSRLMHCAGDPARFAEFMTRLRVLRKEHDAWQQVDDDLRTEQNQLSQRPDRLKRQWEKRLSRKLQELCVMAQADRARDLAVAITQMEAALKPDSTTDPGDALYYCRSAVVRCFNQVDQDLKTFSGQLAEAGGPLDAMLEGLA